MAQPAPARVTAMLVSIGAVALMVGPRADARPAQQGTSGAGKVPMEVSLQVGSEAIAGHVEGVCEHARATAVGNVPTESWAARYDPDSGRSVRLMFWRPSDGSDGTMTLAVTLHGSSHRVSTREVDAAGSGQVLFEPAGRGGTFVIDAKTEAGTVITGKIRCEAFTNRP